MKRARLFAALTIDVLLASGICISQNSSTFRDPYKWPFKSTSIWNMPIGSKARYVHAKIEKAMAMGMTVDEDIIILSPNAPLTEIYANYADWDRTKNHCTIDGSLLFKAPIPSSFIVDKYSWFGLTPNSCLAVLMPDGSTIKQTQPFARCAENEYATSHYIFGDQNIFGDGYYGAHGGSRLSAIGGTLRLGELMPNGTPIRHVMKVNLYGARNYYYDSTTKGYRWPATTADIYAPGNYGSIRTTPTVKECRMGTLLALPPWINIDSLNFETKPGKILAEAFQNYGAYIVDDTAWDVYAIETEWSPEGRFIKDFENKWGFRFTPTSKDTPWARDMDRIFLNLHVIDNNCPDSIGGGGEPRMPMAPDFLSTSINKINIQNRFRIYPNPTNGNIYIETENPIHCPLKVYLKSILGKVLSQNMVLSGNTEINLEAYNTGIYFLEIEFSVDRYVSKIIYLQP